jgi:hypothetical protein
MVAECIGCNIQINTDKLFENFANIYNFDNDPYNEFEFCKTGDLHERSTNPTSRSFKNFAVTITCLNTEGINRTIETSGQYYYLFY